MRPYLILIILALICPAYGLSLSVSSGSGNDAATMSTIAEGDLSSFHQMATMSEGSIQAETKGSAKDGTIAIGGNGPAIEASGTFDLAASSSNGQVSASVVADGKEILSPKMTDFAAATGLSVDVHELSEAGKTTRATLTSPQYYDVDWDGLHLRIPLSTIESGGRSFLFNNQNIPDGATKSEFIAMSQAQANIWNAQSLPFFGSVTESSETTSDDTIDGKNMIYFDPSLTEQSSIIGLTANWYYTGNENIVESDIAFNPHKFDSDGTTYSFENSQLHEFGHALGQDDLFDYAETSEIMYAYASSHPVKWDAPNTKTRGSNLGLTCTYDTYLGRWKSWKYNYGNKFVSAWDTSDLVANRDWTLEGEIWKVVPGYTPGTVAFKSWDGHYVTAWDGPLTADRDWILQGESFTLVDLGNGNTAIQAYNGKYVTAWDGALIANRDWVQQGETFSFALPDGS